MRRVCQPGSQTFGACSLLFVVPCPSMQNDQVSALTTVESMKFVSFFLSLSETLSMIYTRTSSLLCTNCCNGTAIAERNRRCSARTVWLFTRVLNNRRERQSPEPGARITARMPNEGNRICLRFDGHVQRQTNRVFTLGTTNKFIYKKRIRLVRQEIS